jgi:hypothetical protein
MFKLILCAIILSSTGLGLGYKIRSRSSCLEREAQVQLPRAIADSCTLEPHSTILCFQHDNTDILPLHHNSKQTGEKTISDIAGVAH